MDRGKPTHPGVRSLKGTPITDLPPMGPDPDLARLRRSLSTLVGILSFFAVVYGLALYPAVVAAVWRWAL